MNTATTYRYVVAALLSMQLGLCVSVTIAQDRNNENSPSFSIKGNNSARVVIPFELINNLIVVEASLNGVTPMKFILDSGASTTLVTSIPAGAEMYLPSSATVNLKGLGDGESVEAIYTDNNVLELGRITGQNLDVFYLKENIFMLSAQMGTEVHGFIGYDLFANFAVEINYKTEEIFIYDTPAFEEKFEDLPSKRKWYKFPIHIEKKKPYANLTFQHKKGSAPTNLRFLIDTGSNNAFGLYDLTHPEITIPEKRIETLIGVGLNGRVSGYLGRINQMKWGAFEFKKPVVAYPDSISIRHAFGLGDRNGSLGGEVLRRFKVIFNYRDEYILLKKNRDFGDNIYYNLSGIEVKTPYPDLPYYVISAVREHSPADIAGVKAGDIIRSINGGPASNKNLDEVLFELQKKENPEMELEVQRDSVFMELNLNLVNELEVDE